jgi:hypothetical protein
VCALGDLGRTYWAIAHPYSFLCAIYICIYTGLEQFDQLEDAEHQRQQLARGSRSISFSWYSLASFLVLCLCSCICDVMGGLCAMLALLYMMYMLMEPGVARVCCILCFERRVWPVVMDIYMFRVRLRAGFSPKGMDSPINGRVMPNFR